VLARHVAAFLSKECPPERVRAAEPVGFDGELWRQVAAMGLPVMAVPDALGGGVASRQYLPVVLQEHGRHVAPVPLLEASVANNLLARLAMLAPAASSVT